MATFMELNKNFGFKYMLWHLFEYLLGFVGLDLIDFSTPPVDKFGKSHYAKTRLELEKYEK